MNSFRGEKRRIAFLLPDLRGGGAERVAVNLANSFVERGFAVDMVLQTAVGQFLDELRPEIKLVNLDVRRLRWLLPAFVRYLSREKPAAVLAFMWPLTIIALWARRLARSPARIVVAEHTTWSLSELLKRWSVGWQVKTTMHLAFPKADGIVAVSQGSADDLAQFAGLKRENITVINNPVVAPSMPLRVAPDVAKSWWDGSHYRVLAVGTLKNVKDYPTLLRAFAELRVTTDAKLLILGEGGARQGLEALARQLGIESSVFMPGFAKDPSVYVRHAHLHVLSSISEGLPMVIIEALAAGTPVVSTDCPSGPREILSEGRFGQLVPVGDAKALALAMRCSLSAEHDHDALKLRARDFSIDKASDLYLGLLLPTCHSREVAECI